MKKLTLNLLCLLVLLCSCKPLENRQIEIKPTEPALPEGMKILYEGEYGTTYNCSKLPIEIPCGEGILKCTAVELYQEPSEHGYYLYGVVTFDLSGLSSDDIYWLDKDDDFNLKIFVDHEKNSIENEKLSTLCVYKNSGYRYYALDGMDEYRYSFDGSNCTLCIDIGNDKLYDTYRYEFDAGTVKDTAEMSKGLYKAMNRALEQQLEFWKSIFSN